MPKAWQARRAVARTSRGMRAKQKTSIEMLPSVKRRLAELRLTLRYDRDVKGVSESEILAALISMASVDVLETWFRRQLQEAQQLKRDSQAEVHRRESEVEALKRKRATPTTARKKRSR
jgi:hypothetical protein